MIFPNITPATLIQLCNTYCIWKLGLNPKLSDVHVVWSRGWFLHPLKIGHEPKGLVGVVETEVTKEMSGVDQNKADLALFKAKFERFHWKIVYTFQAQLDDEHFDMILNLHILDQPIIIQLCLKCTVGLEYVDSISCENASFWNSQGNLDISGLYWSQVLPQVLWIVPSEYHLQYTAASRFLTPTKHVVYECSHCLGQGAGKNGKVCFFAILGQEVRGEDGKITYFSTFFCTHTTMHIPSILIWLMTCWQGDDFGQEVAGAVLSKSRHQRHLIPLHLATSSFKLYFFKLVDTSYHLELPIRSIPL